MGVGWNPWAELRARPHLILEWASLSGGRGRIDDRGDGTRTITIEASLRRCERAETLGHELVHDELDMLWPPDAPPAIVAKGERMVEHITAKRFLPIGALQAYVNTRVASDMTVTARDVAEEFDTTEELAALALTLLQEDR